MRRDNDIAELRRDLARVKQAYERRYGCAVWDIRCHVDPLHTEVVVHGYVLLKSQRNVVRRITAGHLERKWHYHCEIEALAEGSASDKTGWGRNAGSLLNIYRRPLPLTASTSEQQRNLSTQVKAGDETFRVLFERNGWTLVQLNDGTLGWTPKHLIESSTTSFSSPAVISNHLNGNCRVLIDEAYEYRGTPYLLGGITKLGIDCSGLVQAVYRQALGIGLPKHSHDQMLVGQEIAVDDRLPGDLIFINGNGCGELHVGLYTGDDIVVHASSRQGLVVTEEMSRLPCTTKVIRVVPHVSY